MKITNFFAMTAFIASAVTAVAIQTGHQPFQPESLEIKMHELGKRAEYHPTISPQELQQAVAAKCASLKGTTNEPDLCAKLKPIDSLCQAGPYETANGIVYYISQPQKDGACYSGVSIIWARGEVVDVVPALAQAIKKKCVEAEQKDDPMCEEFLKSGKGVFHVKVFGQESAEGKDFGEVIFGEKQPGLDEEKAYLLGA